MMNGFLLRASIKDMGQQKYPTLGEEINLWRGIFQPESRSNCLEKPDLRGTLRKGLKIGGSN